MLPERIVLTNDDGIDAPGIRALQALIGPEAVLVAPAAVCSGCSHHVTMDRPIRVQQRSAREYAVEGTPGDCVRLAILKFVPGVQIILSGINEGGNLGHDIYLSGTVAAAREAAFHGVPAVALSQYFRPDIPVDWGQTAAMVRQALEAVLTRGHTPGAFWNVNLPHLSEDVPAPQVIFCDYSRAVLPTHYEHHQDTYRYIKGNYHSRTREPGRDVDVCFSGNIAATLLHL